jgi:transcriptional regulator
MNQHTTQLDWLEGRRKRAWELKQQGWKQQDIAVALGVTRRGGESMDAARP